MSLKVTKWVECETEVTISISAADIASALAGEADTARAALMCLNNVAIFMRALHDDVIACMTDEQRGMVRQFLSEQVARF